MRPAGGLTGIQGGAFSGRLRSLAEREWTKILGWPGYGVYRHEINERAKTLKLWVRRKRGNRKPACSGCGRRVDEIHEVYEREVRDLPCFEFRTTVVLERGVGRSGDPGGLRRLLHHNAWARSLGIRLLRRRSWTGCCTLPRRSTFGGESYRPKDRRRAGLLPRPEDQQPPAAELAVTAAAALNSRGRRSRSL